MPLTSGAHLGTYEIVAPLGAGGMGEVYRAHDRRLSRDVALKALPPSIDAHPDCLARFEREAKTLASLNHPNIVTLHSIEEVDGIRFLTMELVEGETLDRLISPGGLPIPRVLELAIPMADALAAAHEKGVVHRDLKPANIMVTRQERLKILDFGLAKLLEVGLGPELTQTQNLKTPLSAVGMVMGTVPYMSPEQVRGAPVDARTDVFALGVVLYELLTGRRPFDAATTADVMNAVLHHEPAALAAFRPDVPAHLSRLVRRCLAKDPERRIQTSKDVRNELEELQHELESGTPRQSPVERRPSQLVERRFALTAAHVRQLTVRNPRLIGHPLFCLDNRIESDTLVIFLHGLGADHRWFERALRVLPYRAVSVSLAGFAVGDTYRPVMGIDDHSQVLRILFRELVHECRPRTTILVGHSAGADQLLRMIASDGGAGVDVAGLVALGPNVSMETLFVSQLYVKLGSGDPDAILETLKSLGQNIHGLAVWLAVQTYFAQTFSKFGSNPEPLKRYAADCVAPFEGSGDPLPTWYRAAREKIPCVRLVFSNEEAGSAEALLARHLEENLLGDAFLESSYVIEPVHHIALLEPELVARHIESVLDELAAQRGESRDRGRPEAGHTR